MIPIAYALEGIMNTASNCLGPVKGNSTFCSILANSYSLAYCNATPLISDFGQRKRQRIGYLNIKEIILSILKYLQRSIFFLFMFIISLKSLLNKIDINYGLLMFLILSNLTSDIVKNSV